MCERVVPTINFDTGLSDFILLFDLPRKFTYPVPMKVTVYRTHKTFDEENYKHDVENAPYHVGENFDDLDEKVWFQNF